jgi:hypothetical protein
MWFMSPVNGSLTRDETIPLCNVAYDCQFSFSRQWIWYQDNGTVILSRPDGRDAQMLVDDSRHPVNPPSSFDWTGEDTLEFSIYRLEQYPDNLVEYKQLIYPGTEREPDLVNRNTAFVEVNHLYTTVIAQQPAEGKLALVYTSYPVGNGNQAYKFYLYDISTGASTFFGRAANPLDAFWTVTGDRLFYRYPSSDASDEPEPWYVYDVATNTHKWFGTLPDGDLSPDGRYIVSWYQPEDGEVDKLREAKQPLPKINIYDLQTGLTRRYFIPQTGYDRLSGGRLWSPDVRYLVMQAQLTSESELEDAPVHVLVLDTQTGQVVDLGYDVAFPVAWVSGGDGGGN